MKLNVGSSNPKGQYARGGWVNLDLCPQGRPTVIASAYEMPFSDNTFDEIHCVHVLEHVARDKWPLMLAEMFRVLKFGAHCYVEVPDFPGQCNNYLTSLKNTVPVRPMEVHIHRTGIWGKTERPGMGHMFGFDEALLLRAFGKIGFDDATLLTKGEEMISKHHRDGPVILVRGTRGVHFPEKHVSDMSFDELRNFILI